MSDNLSSSLWRKSHCPIESEFQSNTEIQLRNTQLPANHRIESGSRKYSGPKSETFFSEKVGVNAMCDAKRTLSRWRVRTGVVRDARVLMG